MNGVISTSMRQKGMNYKLIFGVPIPEIKHIAAAHEPMQSWLVPCGKKMSGK